MAGRSLLGVAVTAVVVLVSACGGSDSQDTPAKPAAGSVRGLARPLYPSCGTTGFAKPIVDRLESVAGGGSTWSLRFNRRPVPGRPPRAGEVTNIVIVEAAPDTPAGAPNPRARNVMIAGHRVALQSSDRQNPASTAQWKTSQGNYVLVADGRALPTIRQLVGCLP